MKTKWMIIPILALALGCTREIENNVTYIDGEITLYASSGENKTRTSLQQDGSVYWSPADCINVFYGSRSGKFTSNNTEPSESAEFKGFIGSFNLDGQTEFVAAYPYSDETSLSGSVLGINLPAEQTAVEGTFADDLFICVAKSKDYNLFFFNVCGGVKFSLTRDDVKKVVFKGNNGEPLAGRLNVEFASNGTPKVSEITDGCSSVTLVAPDGGTFKKGAWYYLVLAPQALSQGYTMEFYGDGLLGTESSDSPVTVRRSAWGVLKNLSPATPSSSDGQIVLERKYLLKNTVAYSYQGGTHFLSPRTIINSEKGSILQVFYWNDDYAQRYGVYLTYTDSSGTEKQEYLAPVKYDEWVAEKLVVAADGTVQYYMDGDLLIDRQLDLPLLRSSQTVSVYFDPYGWWYTHYHYMDDFSLKTPEAQISDDFNDGVIDLTIWEQPANPDGVFEEEGYLQMVQKRTDVDFSLRSKPISLGSATPNPDAVPEAIDMGLPSGLKWASFNLGATKPEEDGGYYSWGETEVKEDYRWDTYKWCNGTGDSMTKYCYDSQYGFAGFTDGKSVLLPEDDAATVKWGNNWRIPTNEETTELMHNSTLSVVEYNGVNVFEVKSKINGNVLYFPIAGYREGSGIYDAKTYRGYYWCSNLDRKRTYDGSNVCLSINRDTSIMPDLYYSGYYTWSHRYLGYSIRPVYGASTTIPVESVSLNKTEVNLSVGETVRLVATILPETATNKSVGWASSDKSIASVSSEGVVTGIAAGSATITVTSADGGKTATCEVMVKESSSVTVPEAIDLGLPSGLKWASFNLGATRPEEYGNYYAWGETEPKEDYSWSTYKWCMGTFSTLTKYNTNSSYGYNGFTDGKTVLDLEDDAAHMNLGDKWRIPTKEEQDELRERCTWEWIQLNGVNGYKVEGPNGNSIFLPSSGLRDNTSFRPSFYEPEPYGYYWSSTISAEVDEDTFYSYLLPIWQTNKGCHLSSRHYGYSIRPVYGASLPDCGNRIYYTSTDGTVVSPNSVSAFGANLVSNDYIDGQGILTFDSEVTSIGSRAFLECSTLSSITIPESVTNIGYAAFAGCHNLASINVPEGVTSIGAHAFESCNMLAEINVPESVTVIADRAFQFCHALKSISIPAKVTRIGESAFIACESLSSISVASGNTVYDSRNNCNAIIETSTNSLIAGCQNTIIPQSVVSINDQAFYASLNMTQVEIPEGVKTIGYRTFAHCYALTSVKIPTTMESIGGLAFETCSRLTQMIVFATVPPSIESDVLSNSYNCKIYVPAGSSDAYKAASGWSTYANRIIPMEENIVSVPEAIDLGLSVKWASFNLGAAKPEDYGDYYGWGETDPYYISQNPLIWKTGKETGYGWSSYKWCEGTAESMTKYCTNANHGYNGFVDNKTTLEPEDDAACIHLGGKWRMPTKEEWQELQNNCTWEWSSMNGVNGCKVTAPNGNSIFLPAAGLYSGVKKIGSDGGYWSSSLFVGISNNAYMLNFHSRGVGIGGTYRYGSAGQAIRPVYVGSESGGGEPEDVGYDDWF